MWKHSHCHPLRPFVSPLFPPLIKNQQTQTNKQTNKKAVRKVESSSRDAGMRSSAESMEIYNTIQQGKEKCPGCNQIIGLDCVQHKGRAWHTGCVKCSQCRNSIDFQAGFTERAGATLCLSCSQASQAASKGFCPECGKTLAGCAVVILNGQKVSSFIDLSSFDLLIIDFLC